jgi:hypothetical protein
MGGNHKYLAKTLGISFLLFVESLLATHQLWNLTKELQIFDININSVIMLSITLLVICYTYALSVGAWNEWLQYVIVPLPIALGIVLIIAQINFIYALLAFLSTYVLITYDVFFSSKLKDQMIKFNPRIILRFSTKGLLFVFAIVGAVLILVSPVDSEQLNIPGNIAHISDQYLGRYVEEREDIQLLRSLGLIQFDFKDVVELQVRNFIEPYKSFVLPVIAFIIFSSIQTLNILIYLVFALTIDLLYYFAKKFGVLKIELRDVQQEVLSF